jgi:hypothetical protein
MEGASGPSDYQIAFLIGMAVIWMFAWKQFTQPTYERYRRFDEILQLLRPQDLRSSGVFFPAYVFYALILSGFYWVLCTFGSLQLLQFLGLNALGIDSPGDSVGALLPASWSDPSVLVELTSSNELTSAVTRVFQGERDVPRNPSVPLTIALAIVGVIPNVPVFVKFEEKLRVVAHRLAGIPGRLFEGTQFLVKSELRPGPPGSPDAKSLRELIGSSAIETIERSAKLAERDPAAVQKTLFKVAFFRELVAGRRPEISWPSYSVQSAYQSVSDRINGRAAELDADLDRLRRTTAEAGDASSEEKRQEIRSHWDGFVRRAEQLESDVCVLLLVFAEKDGPPSDRTAASAQLRGFILQAHHAAARDTVGFNVFVNVLATIVLTAGVFGLLFGFDPSVSQSSDLSYVLNYVVTALMTYAFALVVALAYRQLTIDTTWSSLYEEYWIKGVMQLVVVFLLATAISFFSLCVWNIYVVVQATGNIVILERWQSVLREALRWEWPAAILGGLFAVFLVLGMDYADRTVRKRAGRSGSSGVGPALLGGLVLGIWGAAVVVVRAWQYGFAIDDARLVSAGSLAFLIGAFSGAVVQATLRSIETRVDEPPAAEPAPANGVAAATEP